MANYKAEVFLLMIFFGQYFVCQEQYDKKLPIARVVVAMYVHNERTSLPFALTGLQRLDYPKHSIELWIYCETNRDDADFILRKWAERHRHDYYAINFMTVGNKDTKYKKRKVKKVFWDDNRHGHVYSLRERALNYARKKAAQFLFMLDADVVLTEPATLKILTARRYHVVAPMLLSNGLYSNFWAGETKDYPYEKSAYYRRFVKREVPYRGCHHVPAAQSAVLISLKSQFSKNFTYLPSNDATYTGPVDYVTNFAMSVKRAGYNTMLCNERVYGYVTRPSHFDWADEEDRFTNLKVNALADGVDFAVDPDLKEYVSHPPRSKLGCDMIYMINLDRRPERRTRMEKTFVELGMDVARLPAVDGLTFTEEEMFRMNLEVMPGYEDPYYKRPMKAGEIGCFLSHYTIWKKITYKRYPLTLVLEDDVRFAPNFRNNFSKLMAEIEMVDFDLVYLGRKVLMEQQEEQVTAHTTRPLYSYWTVGYLLTHRGAQKLIDAEPLKKMLPVDEFLPIMFDQHPNTTWKSYFPTRNLVALSAMPLLAEPTHYTGMPGYVSDTERSSVFNTRITYPERRDL